MRFEPGTVSAGDGKLFAVPDRVSSPAFVGRGADLAELVAALRDASSGAPTTVFVGGEAGVGKSRLVEQFAGQARAGGARVLVGECFELAGGGVPYAPFTALLRDLVRDLGVAEVARHAGRGTRVLARVLPELGEADGTADAVTVQAQLFEHLLLLVESLAREQPLVLVVEDAHWAGASTRDLLMFLVRSVSAVPLLLVVTYRSDELHRTHPLRRLLAELDRVRGVRRLDLSRLTRDEVAQQLGGILGAEPEPGLVDAVHERTDGNPLFVEELVCCRRADVVLLREAGLSDTLRDLLLTRVERLPEEGQVVLRAAAVGGVAIDHDLLATVAELPGSDLAAGLRAAVEGNVLVPNERGYVFRHALMREAVYEDLLPGERGRLHARYAEELSRGGSPAPPGKAAAVARHWYAAYDAERALVAAWAAAKEAERAVAYRDRLAMLERVLELWDRVPGVADLLGVQRLDVLEQAVATATNSGDAERGIALATTALREVEAAREPERAALLYVQRARLLGNSGRSGQMPDLREAERLVRDVPPGPALARVLARTAKTLMLKPSDAEAFAYAEEALVVARAVGDTDTEISVLSSLGGLECHLGRPDRAVARFAEARVVAGDRPFLSLATNESDTYEALGEHELAAEVARKGLAEVVEAGLSRTSYLAGNIAEPLIALGRWDEALSLIADGLALEPPPTFRVNLLLLRARVDLGRGDVAAASRAASMAGAMLAEGYVVAQNLLPLAFVEARVAVAEGRLEDALDVVERAMDDEILSRSRRYLWPVLEAGAHAVTALRARAATLRDEVAGRRADRAAAAVHERAKGLAAVGGVEEGRRATVVAELARGRGADDMAAWRAAADAWQRVHQPYEHAWAQLRAAELSAGDGDRDTAAEALHAVRDTADALRAAPLRLAADRLAARANLALADAVTPAPDQATRLGLTPRELEVLRLVTAGRTNRQIAGELFISAKTASVHVSRILAKLGVHGRGEAAAAAHRLRLFDDADEATA